MAILAVVYDTDSGGFKVQRIATEQIGDKAVTSAKIASGAVGGVHIMDGSIVAANLANNAVISGKLGSGIVGIPHLYPWASGKIIVGQGTDTAPILRDRWAAIEFIIDGGGAAITSGGKGYLEIPFPATINQVTLLGDQSGYIKLDIWKDSYGNFPPTSVDSICSGSKPVISSSFKYQDLILTGWNKTIVSGDILAYMVESLASNIQRCTVSLGVNK